jgi:hypothetical protein
MNVTAATLAILYNITISSCIMPAVHHTNSRSIHGTFADIDTSYVAGHPHHSPAIRPE